MLTLHLDAISSIEIFVFPGNFLRYLRVTCSYGSGILVPIENTKETGTNLVDIRWVTS